MLLPKKQVKIAFYDTRDYDRQAFDTENLSYGFKIDYFDFKLTSKTASTAKGFDAVCVFVNDILDKDCLEQLSQEGVQLIILRCAGFNNVDILAANKYLLTVVRVPSYSPEAIAEHTAALLLALTRKIPQAYVRTKGGNFTLEGLTGRNLNGLTVGIIGTGKIGKAFAKIMNGFGMNIILYDKFPDINWSDKNNYEYYTLDEIFQNSDIISLHCPLNDTTKHIINDISISMMKRDAVILNTGRGALIDTVALVKALKEKRIGGAALDVYEEESKYFFADWSENIISDDVLIRLLTFPNVIITSHQAFLTKEALSQIAKISLENTRKVMVNEGGASVVVG